VLEVDSVSKTIRVGAICLIGFLTAGAIIAWSALKKAHGDA
jgi:hypothetical protein